MRHTSCTITRTFERKSGHLNLATGAFDLTKVETVTEPCNVPLFGRHVDTGVCRSCSEGWEVAGNKFASPDEKARALAAAQKASA